MLRSRAAMLATAASATLVAGQHGLYEKMTYNPIGRPTSEVFAAWTTLGDAAVHQDYIRITPDEQHKRGVLVAREPAVELTHEWAVDVTLKIHGNGVSLAGDGLALWYTQVPPHQGTLLGGDAQFHGLGLFVDTYVNSPDQVHPHPYVSMVVNDGTEVTAHDMAGFHTSLHAPAGCPVDVRQVGHYSHKYTTLRLSYAHRTLTLWHTTAQGPDAYTFKPEGEWTRCATIPDIDIPPGYTFGASAATGDVSDNHDIYRFIVRRGAVVWGEPRLQPPPPVAVPTPVDADAQQLEQVLREQAAAAAGGNGDAAAPVAAATPNVGNRAFLQMPSLEKVDEKLRDSWIIKGLEEKMREAEHRLNMLREDVEHRVEGMTEHMDSLLQRLRSTDETLDDRLHSLEEQLTYQLEQLHGEHVSNSQRWIIPFVALCIVVAMLLVWGVRQYRQINKLHKY